MAFRPGNYVHKAHRSAFGCVSPRTPPEPLGSHNHKQMRAVTRHIARSHATLRPPHLLSKFYYFSEKLIRRFFHISPFSSYTNNDHNYGLSHLLRLLQCIQSQTHSLPLSNLRKIRMQNLLRNIPLWRRRLRSQVHVLQHRLYPFAHPPPRSNKGFHFWPLRTTPGGHSLRARTRHASRRTSRRRP
jgi:hypothetical protein